MKINIGAGLKRIDGFVNVDGDALCNPEYLVNLDDPNLHLPFEDNSIDEVVAHHILEHIQHILPLMKELYRVCKHGALVDIEVPHPQHEVFLGDFTHVRPITVNAMLQLSKAYCLDHQKKHGSSTGHAITLGVDFEMLWFDFEYDPFYLPMINSMKEKAANGTITPEEDMFIQRLMREANNVAQNIKMKLKVIK